MKFDSCGEKKSFASAEAQTHSLLIMLQSKESQKQNLILEKLKLRQPTGQRQSNVRTQQKKLSGRSYSYIYYEESLVCIIKFEFKII